MGFHRCIDWPYYWFRFIHKLLRLPIIGYGDYGHFVCCVVRRDANCFCDYDS